jgi:hypothetical protein
MNEYYLIIVDKSIKLLWTRKIDPKLPQESENGVLLCKGKQKKITNVIILCPIALFDLNN